MLQISMSCLPRSSEHTGHSAACEGRCASRYRCSADTRVSCRRRWTQPARSLPSSPDFCRGQWLVQSSSETHSTDELNIYLELQCMVRPYTRPIILIGIARQTCCCVAFVVTLRLFVINTSSLSPAINKLRRLPATSVINLPRSDASVCIAFGGRTVHSTRWGQILAENRDFCLPHLHSTPLFGGFPSEYCHHVWYGKTRMTLLPDG